MRRLLIMKLLWASVGPQIQWSQVASPHAPREQALARPWSLIYVPLMQTTKAHQRPGGVGRCRASADGPFVPTPHRQSQVAPNGPGKSKQAVPRGGDNVLLQSPGLGGLVLIFFNKRLYPAPPKSVHSN